MDLAKIGFSAAEAKTGWLRARKRCSNGNWSSVLGGRTDRVQPGLVARIWDARVWVWVSGYLSTWQPCRPCIWCWMLQPPTYSAQRTAPLCLIDRRRWLGLGLSLRLRPRLRLRLGRPTRHKAVEWIGGSVERPGSHGLLASGTRCLFAGSLFCRPPLRWQATHRTQTVRMRMQQNATSNAALTDWCPLTQAGAPASLFKLPVCLCGIYQSPSGGIEPRRVTTNHVDHLLLIFFFWPGLF